MQRPLLSYDANGTPGLFAQDVASAYYGVGYVHGLHRPLQALILATAARGRLAELVAPKPELVELDARVHRLGLVEHGEREALRLSSEAAHWLDAYLDGLRAGVRAGGQPFELQVLFTRLPQPTRASVLSGLMLSSYLGLAEGQERMERGLVDMVRAGAKTALLTEMFAPHFAAFDPHGWATDVPLGFASPLGTAPAVSGGSNAWAVSGARSASGKALLGGDPHLQVNQLPAIFFEVRARVGNDMWLGATIPGLPGLAVGRTNHLAWSGTFSVADNVDHVVCEPGQTGWQTRNVHLKRRWQKPVDLAFKEHQGESLTSSNTTGKVLSVRWAGAGQAVAQSLHAYMALPLAKNVDAAAQCLSGAQTFALHYILADSSGNVLKLQAGRVPKRASGASGLVPLADQQAPWHGYYTGTELPHTPASQGVVASANEPQFTQDGVATATLAQPNYRLQRITDLLAARALHDVASMQAIQLDVISLQAHALVPRFVAALGREHPIAQHLLGWTGAYDVHNPIAPIFQRCYRACLVALAPELGEDVFRYLLEHSEMSVWFCQAFDRLLLSEVSWQGERGARLKAALHTLDFQAHKTWGETQTFWARHFVLGGLPRQLGLDCGPIPLPGSIATVRQGNVFNMGQNPVAVAPAYRFVCDFAEEGAWSALAGGIDGSRFSNSYNTWLAPWQLGHYHPLLPPSEGERLGARPL